MISVAIDGPAGAGKSTIARAAAKELGFLYADTGALYRAVACYMMSRVDPADPSAVVPLLDEVSVELKFAEGEQRVFLNGEDVSDRIRTPEVSVHASEVSQIPQVRQFLFSLQQDLAKTNSVVMDGRDIGTVVLPHAEVKIFLTADPEVRARRRFRELTEKGLEVTFEEILADVVKRDDADMHRAVSPLRQAEDAVRVDTTDCSLEESIARVIRVIREKQG